MPPCAYRGVSLRERERERAIACTSHARAVLLSSSRCTGERVLQNGACVRVTRKEGRKRERLQKKMEIDGIGFEFPVQRLSFFCWISKLHLLCIQDLYLPLSHTHAHADRRSIICSSFLSHTYTHTHAFCLACAPLILSLGRRDESRDSLQRLLFSQEISFACSLSLMLSPIIIIMISSSSPAA